MTMFLLRDKRQRDNVLGLPRQNLGSGRGMYKWENCRLKKFTITIHQFYLSRISDHISSWQRDNIRTFSDSAKTSRIRDSCRVNAIMVASVQLCLFLPADVECLANVPWEGGDLAGQEGDSSGVNNRAVYPTVTQPEKSWLFCKMVAGNMSKSQNYKWQNRKEYL